MPKVLTELEKLHARHPTLLFVVKDGFDRGKTAEEVQALIQQQYGIAVSASAVSSYRTRRWAPEKEQLGAESRVLDAAFWASGGNRGLDLMCFARTRELIAKSSLKQSTAVRLALLKIRAQDLKEEEFKFKTGQLKPGQPAGDAEENDAAAAAKTARVVRKIKEIFGISPDPEEEDSVGPENPSPTAPGDIQPSGSEVAR